MKTIVITGATSGIGLAAAKALSLRNRLICIGRSKENCLKSEAEIKKLNPDAIIQFFCGDLSNQNEVNNVADQIEYYLKTECGDKLSVLINNAGGVRSWYMTSAEGYELQFALNHLAGFILTYRLLPYLKNAGESRVVFTGSDSHKHSRIHWNDVMYKKRYNCLTAYKQTKMCNMLFARELNSRFSCDGIKAYVVDPGLVNTDIGNKAGGIAGLVWSVRKKYGIPPEETAETYVMLSEKAPAPSGFYYKLCEEKSYDKYADDEAKSKRLFALSEKLCGISYSGGIVR